MSNSSTKKLPIALKLLIIPEKSIFFMQSCNFIKAPITILTAPEINLPVVSNIFVPTNLPFQASTASLINTPIAPSFFSRKSENHSIVDDIDSNTDENGLNSLVFNPYVFVINLPTADATSNINLAIGFNIFQPNFIPVPIIFVITSFTIFNTVNNPSRAFCKPSVFSVAFTILSVNL